MGRKIEVESELNKGSCFEFKIPLKITDASSVQPATGQKTEQNIQLKSDKDDRHVLLVENIGRG